MNEEDIQQVITILDDVFSILISLEEYASDLTGETIEFNSVEEARSFIDSNNIDDPNIVGSLMTAEDMQLNSEQIVGLAESLERGDWDDVNLILDTTVMMALPYGRVAKFINRIPGVNRLSSSASNRLANLFRGGRTPNVAGAAPGGALRGTGRNFARGATRDRRNIPDGDTLRNMTNKDLYDLGVANGIPVTRRMNKNTLVETITGAVPARTTAGGTNVASVFNEAAARVPFLNRPLAEGTMSRSVARSIRNRSIPSRRFLNYQEGRRARTVLGTVGIGLYANAELDRVGLNPFPGGNWMGSSSQEGFVPADEGSVSPTDGEQNGEELFAAHVIDQRSEGEATTNYVHLLVGVPETADLGAYSVVTNPDLLAQYNIGIVNITNDSEWEQYWVDNWESNDDVVKHVVQYFLNDNPEGFDVLRDYVDSVEEVTPAIAKELMRAVGATGTALGFDLEEESIRGGVQNYTQEIIKERGPNVTTLEDGLGGKEYIVTGTGILGSLQGTIYDFFSNGTINPSNASQQINYLKLNDPALFNVLKRYLVSIDELELDAEGGLDGITDFQVIDAYRNVQYRQIDYSVAHVEATGEMPTAKDLNRMLIDEVISSHRAVSGARASLEEEQFAKDIGNQVADVIQANGYNLTTNLAKEIQGAVDSYVADVSGARAKDAPGTYRDREIGKMILEEFVGLSTDSSQLAIAFDPVNSDGSALIQASKGGYLNDDAYNHVMNGELRQAREAIDRTDVVDLAINKLIDFIPNTITEQGYASPTTKRNWNDAFFSWLSFYGDAYDVNLTEDQMTAIVDKAYSQGKLLGEDPYLGEAVTSVSEEVLKDRPQMLTGDMARALNLINQQTTRGNKMRSIFPNA